MEDFASSVSTDQLRGGVWPGEAWRGPVWQGESRREAGCSSRACPISRAFPSNGRAPDQSLTSLEGSSVFGARKFEAMQGLEDHLVETLRDGFGGRPTVTFAQACKLLNINAKTLRRHVRRGTIAFRRTGLGKFRVRREFALQDLVGFYTGVLQQADLAYLSPPGHVARRKQASFLQGYAARRAARKERKRHASA
ncbi:excisionase family DNA-binding protein [Bradyrhizobium sp. CB1650]|uniref:helix-turn-helix domain-containing protein n=1 Tax=Bradyrhizobium sp. CB1650 TaxID=3039153 RepID=UPI002435833B|nr:helix-turn-helix domain-containing protein [Bradyrhizobium sp. CB1650]WGD51462.1 excisionase family DNA-binding protein [Bradyrhizobium sp. CB1650]